MHNAEEKMLEANLKDDMIGQTKNQILEVELHMISTKCDDNLKTTLG
jgi:hypothetical protein